jgi:hypothetical protein
MTITAPTRITIEVHPPTGDAGPDAMPVVRIADASAAPAGTAQAIVAGEPREDAPAPAPYDPGPCRCLDDEDCGADHAND